MVVCKWGLAGRRARFSGYCRAGVRVGCGAAGVRICRDPTVDECACSKILQLSLQAATETTVFKAVSRAPGASGASDVLKKVRRRKKDGNAVLFLYLEQNTVHQI